MEEETSKKKARTSLSFVFKRERHTEIQTDKVSLTVPDETYSIKDILHRFTTGQSIGDTLYREPSYDSSADFDSDDVEKLKHMDLYEREEYSRDLKTRIKANEAKIDSDRKKEQASKKQEEDDLLSLKNEIKERKEREKQSGKGGATGGASSPSGGNDAAKDKGGTT